jgi:hypothetical protein
LVAYGQTGQRDRIDVAVRHLQKAEQDALGGLFSTAPAENNA